uniref:NADH-ubiquinone oxidoreductase chain 1 n=1 Tax=Ophioplinthus gelida TaxID=696348 RepID=A0A3G2WHY9_9ECHI|nr:NADH dehydrogenase subunit 1 [Ophioplinthus gelida]AYO99581.1 NADH dehydrogenase subunit 1 [Ophioplinthus gelida]
MNQFHPLFYGYIHLTSLWVFLIPMLISVALLTLLERKTLGYIQLRKGPNLIGPLGLLQPFADGLKLFIKEPLKPSNASTIFYITSPPLFFFLAILLWSITPVNNSNINISLSFLFILTITNLTVYPILGAGWSSNSKWALLGALRAVAQTISYEVSLGLIVIPLVILVGSWGLTSFSSLQSNHIWIIYPCLPLFMLWFISSLAETNRTPFDLAEGESELVSGYNVEYAGAAFALFFIGEYANIIFINILTVVLFLGPYQPHYNAFALIVKSLILIFIFLWVRSSFPRVRYDQLMALMWKNFLPLTLSLLPFYFVLSLVTNAIPPHF